MVAICIVSKPLAVYISYYQLNLFFFSFRAFLAAGTLLLFYCVDRLNCIFQLGEFNYSPLASIAIVRAKRKFHLQFYPLALALCVPAKCNSQM